ncbi:mannose-6-phosphate isomerase [Lysobacter helvus]|uniref:Mannose-6-phosphate isomerase n=2 Tax=Lysobacteraceae TaxID=32033 RepID=A0ABN6FU94_9GAMM|nr:MULTISPECIES: cupin domain-containing protein [Lysobacter]BCT93185.1 mannose-6-phosphate isomerase [Lysobacter caseinilyticus]BCT96337.1 mannose-6-phosphate isomerase [Lysobacter helvus]
MTAVNLQQKPSMCEGILQSRISSRFNGMDVAVVKSNGPFAWHSHEETDDFYFVLQGALDIDMRHDTVQLGPGDCFVVPAGVEHRPIARGETHFLQIEPICAQMAGNAATVVARRVI